MSKQIKPDDQNLIFLLVIAITLIGCNVQGRNQFTATEEPENSLMNSSLSQG
jgi:hypothetical protein